MGKSDKRSEYISKKYSVWYRRILDRFSLLTIMICLFLYFAAATFLNRYWGGILSWLSIRRWHGWALAFSKQAALTVFLLCMMAVCGQWRVFRQKRLPFFKGLIPGAYMLVMSLGSIILDLTQAEGFSTRRTVLFSTLYFILIGVTEELIFRGITADLILRFWGRKVYDREPVGAKEMLSGAEQGSMFVVIQRSGLESDRRGMSGQAMVILSVVISSAIFSLSHLLNIRYADAYGVVIQMAGAFLMGMVLTVVYYRSRNIWCVIFIHAVNDIAGAFSVTVLRSENNVTGLISSYGIGELVMLIPYVIVLAVIMRKSKTEGIVGEFSSEKEGEADAI